MLKRKIGIKWYVHNGVIYSKIHIFITSRNQQINYRQLLKVVISGTVEGNILFYSFFLHFLKHTTMEIYSFILRRNIIKIKIGELPGGNVIF